MKQLYTILNRPMPHYYPLSSLSPILSFSLFLCFFSVKAQWVNTLPLEVQDSIYWIGDMEEVTTLESEIVVWGIGNYTDHISGGPIPGTATLYVDDCLVGTLPVHPYVSSSTSRNPSLKK